MILCIHRFSLKVDGIVLLVLKEMLDEAELARKRQMAERSEIGMGMMKEEKKKKKREERITRTGTMMIEELSDDDEEGDDEGDDDNSASNRMQADEMVDDRTGESSNALHFTADSVPFNVVAQAMDEPETIEVLEQYTRCGNVHIEKSAGLVLEEVHKHNKRKEEYEAMEHTIISDEAKEQDGISLMDENAGVQFTGTQQNTAQYGASMVTPGSQNQLITAPQYPVDDSFLTPHY
eukprot:MONOS_6338.1-p1 / transcript=MONOS_6338.1 / gene=MONOS_6338 / organism=Monocercomonoides_exilis_PA203 / gene_product=unspecified product / transcript_product=unspecified product / location=Mono_scaffold00198:44546-45250(-) / protein_length=235 / sequence_SO=supercontig / SO=protein_coding / is_pseudo=false